MREQTPWRMPAEWAGHERTWMAWPSNGYTLGDTPEEVASARQTWAAVARAARFVCAMGWPSYPQSAL